jgi:RecA-family ATPase
MNSETAIRCELRAAGYLPIPVEGKIPPLKEWQKRTDTNTQELELWERLFPLAKNTGLLTRTMPTLDIDILNPDAAVAVEDLVRERFEERGYILVRIGLSPKRAIPFRTNNPFAKIVCNVELPGCEDKQQKLEFLADGQQIVAHGTHPQTGQPYSWHGGEPGEKIKLEELPYISEAEAQQLVADAAELLKQFGYEPKKTRKKKGNGIDDGQGEKQSTDWGWLVGNIIQGRELHDTTRDLAASLVASGMSDGAAVNHLRGLIEQAPRDDRWLDRYNDIPRLVSTAKEKIGEQENETPPLPYISMSSWDEEPIPEPEWTVFNKIPRGQCVLFSGEGAIGKSSEGLHLSAAHVLARDCWLTLPEPGPAIYVDAEDNDKVLHRRLAAITAHYQVKFADLIKGGLHLISLVGQDAVLAASNRNGKIQPTPRYKQLLEAAGDIKPVEMIIASSANVFAGSEIDRAQVQQFISLLTRLAIVANGSVVLISHPSLTGINTDTGLSGSTQWHNAVRARFYMKGVKSADGEQPENNLREIVFKKNQYGPISDQIVLRYQDGMFLPVPGMTSLDQAAHEAKVNDIFLALLRRFAKDNRFVSDKPGRNYAPALFAKEGEATREMITSKALEAAMRRLFATGVIWNEPYGKASRGSFRIALKLGA